MLDAHPQIAIPLDTVGLWDRWEHTALEYGDLGIDANRRRVVAAILQEERIRLWQVPLTADLVLQNWRDAEYSGLINAFFSSYAELKGKASWGDKDPGNMVRIDQLNRWFPDSRFIHIIRDGRDACLSHLEQTFGFNNLLACAEAWREEVQWVRRIGALLGDRYHELKYEDLVADTETVLRRICAHLQVDYSDSMLLYHENVGGSIPAEKRHIWPMLDKPPQKDLAGRWKVRLSEGERICFEKRAGRVLREMSYETLPSPSGAYWTEVRSHLSSITGAVYRRLGIDGRNKQ